MIERFKFFCVYCEKLVQNEESSSIFKTGYYQYAYPMGTCTKCTQIRQELRGDSQIIDKKLE